MPALVVRPVVRAEQYQRVLVQPEPLQQLEEPPDVPVHARNHRRLPLVLRRPVLVRINPEVRHLLPVLEVAVRLIVRVRCRQRQVEEERPVLLLLHPLQTLRRDEVVRIFHLLTRVADPEPLRHRIVRAAGRDLVPQLYLLLPAHQKVRVIIVRVVLVRVAEEVVESLSRRQTHCRFALVAEPPLADERRRIARRLQRPRHRHVPRPERLRQRIDRARVAAHTRVPRVQPRHQHAAARSAHRGPRVKLREPHPLRRHAVQVRRLNQLLPVAPEVSVTKVVR